MTKKLPSTLALTQRAAVTRVHIAMRIRAAREQAGISQGDAATLMNLTQGQISRIESGAATVSSDHLGHFAELYKVKVSFFTEGV